MTQCQWVNLEAITASWPISWIYLKVQTLLTYCLNIGIICCWLPGHIKRFVAQNILSTSACLRLHGCFTTSFHMVEPKKMAFRVYLHIHEVSWEVGQQSEISNVFFFLSGKHLSFWSLSAHPDNPQAWLTVLKGFWQPFGDCWQDQRGFQLTLKVVQTFRTHIYCSTCLVIKSWRVKANQMYWYLHAVDLHLLICFI